MNIKIEGDTKLRFLRGYFLKDKLKLLPGSRYVVTYTSEILACIHWSDIGTINTLRTGGSNISGPASWMNGMGLVNELDQVYRYPSPPPPPPPAYMASTWASQGHWPKQAPWVAGPGPSPSNHDGWRTSWALHVGMDQHSKMGSTRGQIMGLFRQDPTPRPYV